MNPAAAHRRFSAACGLAALSLLGLPLPGAEDQPGTAREVYELPPLRIKGEAKCSYGMSLTVIREPETRKVVRLFIAAVHENTSAARFGLKPGDEILSLNGEKVRGMSGEFNPGSRLFALLINRPVGDVIEVEVMSGKLQRVTLKVVSPTLPELAVQRLGF